MLCMSSFLLECPHILAGKITNEEQVRELHEALRFKPQVAVLPVKEWIYNELPVVPDPTAGKAEDDILSVGKDFLTERVFRLS